MEPVTVRYYGLVPMTRLVYYAIWGSAMAAFIAILIVLWKFRNEIPFSDVLSVITWVLAGLQLLEGVAFSVLFFLAARQMRSAGQKGEVHE